MTEPMVRARRWIDSHPTMRFYVPFVVTLTLIVQLIQTAGGCQCR